MGLVVILVFLLGFAVVLGATFVLARAVARRTRLALSVPLLIGTSLGLLALNPYWISLGPEAPDAELDRFVLWVLLGLPCAIGLAVGAGVGGLSRPARGPSSGGGEWDRRGHAGAPDE
ncbi:hypothetical protein [Antarcticimicrobium sediminis]|uniref:Uncharacterized protein n=1 Tax=Antarcticimicrobium sediminis TaxID=2546227 RepID=A0A4V2Z8N8_9RHOB|nr:hypothetical protein [Antarcticimicrobium sediminis]TDE41076.1 hypothetical protein E1B25_02370 [Antarcticimicrobium sediminis]